VTETGARPGSQTGSLAHDFKKILKEKNMKKLLVLAVAFSVMVVVCSRVSAIAQDNSGGQTTPAAPLKVIKGTIKADGEKISFVSDEDKKSWDIINPEAVKGHEGHHVQVSAHVYADKNQIHVMSVKMMR
jgi:hypothetical protein